MATLRTVDARPRIDRKKKQEADDPILSQARSFFRRAETAEAPMRLRMRDDQRFAANLTGREQWDVRALAIREKEERPALSIDRLSQPIYSIVNQQREVGVSLQVQPVDNDADPDTAEVIQGLTRNIENQSHAKLAYMWAFEAAVRMGRGYVRIVPEFVMQPNKRQFEAQVARGQLDPRLFDQDLRIKRILNPFTVYFDPSCQEPDYSDARWAFVTQDISLEEYRATYGTDSWVSSLDDFSGLGDDRPYWVVEGGVRLAEFYTIESTFERLVLVRDRMNQPIAVLARSLQDLRGRLAAQDNFLQGGIELQRNLEIRQIQWYKICGVEILEQREVPGKWIPIIPIIGEEIFVDGQRDYRGIVRGAKEAAKGYNFQVTALIEAVNLMPKAPFVIAAGQVAGFEEIWKNANTVNSAYLPYKQVDVAGRPVPPPQRNPAMPPIGPLVSAILQMDNDIKAATRYYDASLGKPGPEESGRAIAARQRQGDVATADFSANFREVSLAHIGRILVDLIPYYYDTARVARIIGADEQQRTVRLNTPYVDETGKERLYRLDVGQYDVTVTAGPAWATKQEQTREMLTETLRAAPQIFPVVGDLYMKALGLYDIAKRLEKALPPEFKDDKDGQPPIPPEVRQQVEMMAAEAQALQQALAEAQRKLEAQMVKAESDREVKMAELAAKERIEKYKVDADLLAKRLDLTAKQALARLQAQADENLQAVADAAKATLQDDQQAHEVGMAVMEHEHALEAQQAAAHTAMAHAEVQHEHRIDEQQRSEALQQQGEAMKAREGR